MYRGDRVLHEEVNLEKKSLHTYPISSLSTVASLEHLKERDEIIIIIMPEPRKLT